jgi:hypothetical protein
LPISKAAKIIGCSVNVINTWIRRGKIKCFPISNAERIFPTILSKVNHVLLDEVLLAKTLLGKKQCSKCHQYGHNSNTCGLSEVGSKRYRASLKRRDPKRFEEEKIKRKEYCRNWRNENHRLIIKKREALRLEVLAHYNNLCACCGYNDITKKLYKKSFLQIDHINGDGAAHRKLESVNGSGIYLWLKNNNYPAGFRVLCAGCNHAIEPGANKCLLHQSK